MADYVLILGPASGGVAGKSTNGIYNNPGSFKWGTPTALGTKVPEGALGRPEDVGSECLKLRTSRTFSTYQNATHMRQL